ncbi:MAG: hypothetical protein VCB77_09615, partial [Alphaproteobacteria bacterium]
MGQAFTDETLIPNRTGTVTNVIAGKPDGKPPASHIGPCLARRAMNRERVKNDSVARLHIPAHDVVAPPLVLEVRQLVEFNTVGMEQFGHLSVVVGVERAVS